MHLHSDKLRGMKLKNRNKTPKNGVALCAANPSDRARICVALNAPSGDVPEWVVLLPAGPLVQGYDNRSWTMPDAEAVAAASNTWAKSMGAPLDECHATQLQSKAPACGWFEEYRVAENGAIEARVDWTELGRGFVSRKEYRFISAAFDYDIESREILCCIGGGLTNAHNLRVPALNQTQEEETMDPKVLAALGLTPVGDAAKDTAAALNAIQTLKDEKATALNAAQAPSLDKFVPRADYDTALNRATDAEQKLQQIETDGFRAKVETAVNAAVKAGKVSPATKQYHLDTIKDDTALNSFEATYGKAPALVDEQAAGKDGTPPDADTALNSTDKTVAGLMGVSEEDLKEYGS
jgi:phage I-like protein